MWLKMLQVDVRVKWTRQSKQITAKKLNNWNSILWSHVSQNFSTSPIFSRPPLEISIGMAKKYEIFAHKKIDRGFVPHEYWDDPAEPQYDIALVRVEGEGFPERKGKRLYEYNSICLPTNNRFKRDDIRLELAGWGIVNPKDTDSDPDILHKTRFKYDGGRKCRRARRRNGWPEQSDDYFCRATKDPGDEPNAEEGGII